MRASLRGNSIFRAARKSDGLKQKMQHILSFSVRESAEKKPTDSHSTHFTINRQVVQCYLSVRYFAVLELLTRYQFSHMEPKSIQYRKIKEYSEL